jgi:predicted RNA-binding Zn-ribbon protein involved in translation (DUF1610 family)
MSACPHTRLVVLQESHQKLRCRHCHLTIAAAELGEGWCPECYEATGDKRYDFEALASEDVKATRYRCEDCGIIIEEA